jgi:HNH endonuclease
MTRYLSKVAHPETPSDCWDWTGGHDKDGYGIFWDGTYRPSGRGRYVRVTRWTYEQFVGPIPPGEQVLHRCDNPRCVNRSHLFTGTTAVNHADREAKGRGVRKHGSTNVGAKLTESDVEVIRTARAQGRPQIRLAREFGVSAALVSKIVNRKAWQHV